MVNHGVRGAQSGGPVPFILATPHHSNAWARSYPSAYQAELAELEDRVQQYEAALAELEQAGDQLTPEELEGAEQLYEEYQALIEEYGWLQSRA